MAQPVEILLIEDVRGSGQRTRDGLRDAKIGNSCHVVTHGTEALQYLRREGPHHHAAVPDLILLDMHLQDLIGSPILDHIKSDPTLRGIPVVVLAGSPADEVAFRNSRLQANACVTKPVDLPRLVELVQTIEPFGLSLMIGSWNT